MPHIRILLADDHAVVREGLRSLLERQPDMSVVAEAADGRECVRLAEEHVPDVVMMDIAMPYMNGIEATRRILSSCPNAAVVMLSMHQDESYVLGSLKAGARGFLLKDSLRDRSGGGGACGQPGPRVPYPPHRPDAPGRLRCPASQKGS